MSTHVGVDVSLRRGLDVVVIDDDLDVLDACQRVDSDGLGELLRAWSPVSVAIDSPPGPPRDPAATARRCEVALRSLGVQAFSTPGDPDRLARPFYGWIAAGRAAFAVAERAGYPRQDAEDVVRGRALEVFPHATDVFVRGGLPPAGTTRTVRAKRAWRTATLESVGLRTARLCRNRNGAPTMDSIDAALAAFTARCAATGDVSSIGDDGEWVVVPGRVPDGRFARCLP